MKLVLPIGARFEALPVKNQKTAPAHDPLVRFRYEEWFALEHCVGDVAARTLKAAGPMVRALGCRARLRRDKRGVIVTGTVRRSIAGGFIASEFLAWSSIGSVTMRQLMAYAGIGVGVEQQGGPS